MNDIVVNEDVLKPDGTLNGDGSGFREWTPIGTTQYLKFGGVFDGQGHTVSGLYHNKDAGQIGLVGYMDINGSVKNVGVVDSYISGSKWVGAVCGRNDGGTIQDCYSESTVKGSDNTVGGVCGTAGGTYTVKDCHNTGTVSAVNGTVGGVVGSGKALNCYNTGTVESAGGSTGGVVGSGDVQNCYNTGAVNSTKGASIGGVSGTGNAQECYNEGNITGAGNNVGGVVGSFGGTISRCYNTGTVTGGASYTGGVIGYGGAEYCYNTGSVTGVTAVGGVRGGGDYAPANCYNTGMVTGDTNVGGVAGERGAANCYNVGTVTGNTSVGAVIGNVSIYTVTNCFYLPEIATDGKDSATHTVQNGKGNAVQGETTEDVAAQTMQRPQDFFTSGLVAYCLNGDQSKVSWYQNVGTEDYPVLDDTHARVVPEISRNADDTYHLAGVRDLYWFAALVNAGENDLNATLMKDITINENLLDADRERNKGHFLLWTPIGQNADNKKYTGVFDGQGHRISGLYYFNESTSCAGLFGYITGTGTIKDVTLADSWLRGMDTVGGICGYNYAGTILRCSSSSSVSGVNDYIGGMLDLERRRDAGQSSRVVSESFRRR